MSDEYEVSGNPDDKWIERPEGMGDLQFCILLAWQDYLESGPVPVNNIVLSGIAESAVGNFIDEYFDTAIDFGLSVAVDHYTSLIHQAVRLAAEPQSERRDAVLMCLKDIQMSLSKRIADLQNVRAVANEQSAEGGIASLDIIRVAEEIVKQSAERKQKEQNDD